MEPSTNAVPKTASRAENLTPNELPWLARYDFLKERGYLLRPRYRPGWTPSWKTNPGLRRLYCEDWYTIEHTGLLDAQRIADGLVVLLKEIEAKSPEGPITCFLSSDPLKNDPRNHAVPVLDVLVDKSDDQKLLLVLPLLRQIDSPDFESISEALDLVEQTLDGLAFLHENEVAHRDCSVGNILMDARAMFPFAWHPQSPVLDSQARRITSLRSRTEVGGVRYYFIDFGLSTRGEDLTTGFAGNERAPELSPTVPYDPYRLDIYILGKMYQEILLDDFINLGFLQPLIDRMTSKNPADRPSAAEACTAFKDLRASLDLGWFNQRLRTKEKSLFSRTLRESSYWLHLQLTRFSGKPVLSSF